MTIRVDHDITRFLLEKIKKAKVTFERAVDCKHTEFDDLYPYISEHPQFFWYKRYVAWQDLLTLTSVAEELGLDWTIDFNDEQVSYIRGKVMAAKVLDHWFEERTE